MGRFAKPGYGHAVLFAIAVLAALWAMAGGISSAGAATDTPQDQIVSVRRLTEEQ